MGPFTTADLDTDTDNMAGVRFASSASLVCKSITFDGCTFTGTTYGINTDQQIQGIVVCNSTFDILYKGIVLGEGTPVLGGPTGFRIVNNSFDNIYAEGVLFGDIELNATGHNIFYDVGNHFNGATSPATSIIVFEASNNISVGDMFERADAYATTFQRINLNNQASIGFVGGEILKIGPNEIQAEPITTLSNNASNQTIYTFDATLLSSVSMSYSIVRSTGVRNGVFTVIPAGGGSVNYNDDYVENTSVGVTLSATQAGDQVSIKYTTTNTGTSGTITFTISSFRV
jgi:hypothetical protein